MKARDVLHTSVVQDDEVIVYVTNLINGSCIVREPFRELLSECGQPFIRWKSRYVRPILQDVEKCAPRNVTSQAHCFEVFE
jgi:hypothetical protein